MSADEAWNYALQANLKAAKALHLAADEYVWRANEVRRHLDYDAELADYLDVRLRFFDSHCSDELRPEYDAARSALWEAMKPPADDALPYTIQRACCIAKSCDPTTLYLSYDGDDRWSYKRVSNNDVYAEGTLAELRAFVDSPHWRP